MSIGSISGVGSFSPYSAIAPTSSSTAGAAGIDADGDNDGSKAAAGGSKLSPQALFLSMLQQLEKTDPTKAKQVLTDLADKIRTDAKAQSGPQAQNLNALADSLQKAADSGDLSGLAQNGGHHGHHKAQAAYSHNAGSSQSLLDLLNTELNSSSATAPVAAATSTPTVG